MRIKILLLLLFICAIITSSLSQNETYNKVDDLEDIKKRLASTSERTVSLNSSFIQEKQLWILEEVIVSKGTFLFKKPGNILWQYHTPVNYTISIYNDTFTIDNDGNISSFDLKSNPMFQEINKMIVTAIRGDFIDNPDFTSLFYVNRDFYKAVLIPVNKAVSSMITAIDIYFSKENLQVSKVVFHEPGEDLTSIEFSNTVINEEIEDSSFIIEK